MSTIPTKLFARAQRKTQRKERTVNLSERLRRWIRPADDLKITYPGSGNNSQFSYDGQGRCAKIVETVSSTVTSTKQFLWCGGQMCEARDGSGNVLSQYFGRGQTASGSSYYYTSDHLGSVCEMTNSSGTIVWQQNFDPYGQPNTRVNTSPADFGYSGYYLHQRSGLNLTIFRQYSPSLGSWLSRDPIGEAGGVNLYGYVQNNPITMRDPWGLWQLVIQWNSALTGPNVLGDALTPLGAHGNLMVLPDPGEDFAPFGYGAGREGPVSGGTGSVVPKNNKGPKSVACPKYRQVIDSGDMSSLPQLRKRLAEAFSVTRKLDWSGYRATNEWISDSGLYFPAKNSDTFLYLMIQNAGYTPPPAMSGIYAPGYGPMPSGQPSGVPTMWVPGSP